MSAPTYDVPAVREGWAAALVTNLFPGIRTKHPKVFAHDVQFIYDWEASVHGGTRNDPLNLRKHDFKNPHDAMIASMEYLHTKKSVAILAALEKGDYDAAKHALSVRNVTVASKGKMPSRIDSSGNYGASGVPSIWDEIGGTLSGMPGQAGKDLGGIGGALNHTVLIVLAIVAVIIIAGKK